MKHLFHEACVHDGWLCLKVENRLMARQEVAQMRPDVTYEVEVKQHRKARSLDANAYAWVLMGRLAPLVGTTKEGIYREYIPDIGDNCEIKPVRAEDVKFFGELWRAKGTGWVWEDLDAGTDKPMHQVQFYKGSSSFNSLQMSRLIDLIIYDCKENGIETLTPQELDRMKARWKHEE